MRASLERRIDALEKARAAHRQIRFVFRDSDETDVHVEARKRALIARGLADPNDLFITFAWG
jgi:hypothetical protein